MNFQDKIDQNEYFMSQYEEMFSQRHIPNSCMARGLEFGDGWLGLMKELCEYLKSECPGIKIAQAKEKFAELTVYVDFPEGVSNDDINRILKKKKEICKKSSFICETCGEPGKLYSYGGWLSAACARHAHKEAVPIRNKNDDDNEGYIVSVEPN